METTYSISELEQLTGTNRRTIYYYVTEKILPPPVGAGLAARYSEVHYLRLLLIARMQKSHMRLQGIKEALDEMSIEQMRTLAGASDRASMLWNRKSVTDRMQRLEEAPFSGATQTHPSNRNYSFVSPADPTELPKGEHKGLFSFLGKKNADTSAWQRVTIMEGLEINVRADIMKKYGRLLGKLLEEFKRHI